jgi:hypothetical protein
MLLPSEATCPHWAVKSKGINIERRTETANCVELFFIAILRNEGWSNVTGGVCGEPRERWECKHRIYENLRALRFDMAAQPLVDLSALRQMYSTAATLSIVYSQEVCGTEEKVGGMGIMCSGIENK